MFVQTELSVYMNKALEEERKKLRKGEQPPTEDGCFTSPLAHDVIPVAIVAKQASFTKLLRKTLTNKDVSLINRSHTNNSFLQMRH